MHSRVIIEIINLDEKLKNIKLSSITVKAPNFVQFSFISNLSADDDLTEKIKKVIKKYLPNRFTDVSVKVSKIVTSPDLVSNAILRYINENFMSVSGLLDSKNIFIEEKDGIVSYTLSSSDEFCLYAEKNDVVNKINANLETQFCSKFNGVLEKTGKSSIDTEFIEKRNEVSTVETITLRTFDVSDVVSLWGEETCTTAIYIADADLSNGNVVFAGNVDEILEKETKTGKKYYALILNDSTGILQAKIFLNKDKEQKMKKIAVGSQVIVRGDLDDFNGFKSFIVRDLAFCLLPKDFKAIDRESKSVPKEYSLIFPEKIVIEKQNDLFYVEEKVENCLLNKTFVVIDIETTGTNYSAGDKITEIGAVKIVNGVIYDKFQTLINPGVNISEKITSLTGITNEMVENMPVFDDVVGDLFKYVDGATIIAHNIDFDYGFIKFLSKKSGYVFTNDGIDTLALSREILPRLKNHKLNTVCEHFNIVFRHHRALSDAYATAELFLNLIKIKKSL